MKSLVLIVGVICIVCFLLPANGVTDSQYKEVDPRVFRQDAEEFPTFDGRKVVSPGEVWTWHNSWHLIRRQPGIFGIDIGKGPYTVRRSFDEQYVSNYTWAHYCFYLYKGEVREKYDASIVDIEKKIHKERGHVANVVRIDKLDEGSYIVSYVRSRSSYKRFYLREIDAYPPFNLAGNITVNDEAIIFSMKVKSLDPYDRVIYEYQNMRISIIDILLLNPSFFQMPTELEDLLIPYDFFSKGLIYEHPEIIKRSEDPMIIKATDKGVIYRFRKKTVYEEL